MQKRKFSQRDTFSGGLTTCFENSVMVMVPMDLLHFPQIGKRFEMSVAPPFAYAMLCPHSKLNTSTIVLHQVTAHFDSNLLPF